MKRPGVATSSLGFFLGLFCLGLCPGPALVSPAAAGDIRLVPGSSTVITLPENLTTGYSWAVDPDASANLDILTISDGGHVRGASRVGAAGARRFVVSAVSPGQATVSLIYRRPWEKAAGRRQSYTITVAPD